MVAKAQKLEDSIEDSDLQEEVASVQRTTLQVYYGKLIRLLLLVVGVVFSATVDANDNFDYSRYFLAADDRTHSTAIQGLRYLCLEALASEYGARKYLGLPADRKNLDTFAMALIEKYQLSKEEVRELLKSGDLFGVMVESQEPEIGYLVHTMCNGEFEQLVGYKLD